MAMPFVAALPLRSPVYENDFAGALAFAMDHNNNSIGLSSDSCKGDLEEMDRLRKEIATTLRVQDNQEELPLDDLSKQLSKYYHFLVECDSNGLADFHLNDNNNAIKWKSNLQECGGQVRSVKAELVNVMWDLAAVEAHKATKENQTTRKGWNEASKRLQNAASWIEHLLGVRKEHHTMDNNNESDSKKEEHQQQMGLHFGLCPISLRLWQALLLAQAQHCAYESATCVKKPIYNFAAKFAAAAVPLYAKVEAIGQGYPGGEPPREWMLFSRSCGAYLNAKAEYHQSQSHREKKDWGQELARLDVACQHAAIAKNLCEHDESGNSNTIHSTGSSYSGLNKLGIAIDDLLNILQIRMDVAQHDNDTLHRKAIPMQQELTEIIGEKIVKCDVPISTLLKAETKPPPLFQQNYNNYHHERKSAPPAPAIASAVATSVVAPPAAVAAAAAPATMGHASMPPPPNKMSVASIPPPPRMPMPMPMPNMMPSPNKMMSPGPLVTASSDSPSFLDRKKKASPSPNPNLKTYAEVFRMEMTEVITELTRDTDDLTQSARLALADVNLPHSLTAYKQEQSGGGLPDDLWKRVEILQEGNTVVKLKQDLWDLKDASDLARSTLVQINRQLDFDQSTDKTFREGNPDFEGHSVYEVHNAFRRPLANYDKLMSSAQEGDQVLFKRLEALDLEPKYNLLQFSKSQLDRLLPGSRNNNTDESNIVDTEHLSYLLSQLSDLFQERANLMNILRKEFQNFNIVREIQARIDATGGSTDHDYLDATKHSQKAFDSIRYEIATNMERQNELLQSILMENESFMNAREKTAESQSADSCIAMIEDAIEEINQLEGHLREGKEFYNVVIPKLEELKTQVDGVSTRLTVERMEFQEKETRVSQERKDALMAKNLSSSSEPEQKPPGAPKTEGAATEPSTAAAASNTTASNSTASNIASSNTAFNTTTRNTAAPAAASSVPPRGVAARTMSTVDDEKVATLVAMEFDAEKVVAALEKHSNDMDQALNELLSSS